MGLFALIGLILVIFGAYELVTGAVLFGIIIIVVGLVVATWTGSGYYRRRGPL